VCFIISQRPRAFLLSCVVLSASCAEPARAPGRSPPRAHRYGTDPAQLRAAPPAATHAAPRCGAVPSAPACSPTTTAFPHGSDFRERSGLLANSVCFVSKSVLWCFAMFCGVLQVFCGCFAVFCKCFSKNSVLRCFAVSCECFAMFWTCFANVFCSRHRHFLSERKTHSTVLRCIAQSVFCSFCAFCIFFGLFCAVL